MTAGPAQEINREAIAKNYQLIQQHIRRTPVIEVAAGDLGLSGSPITFKLEFLQHTGSFKARGAFTNLLTRPVPAAGVTAASGGNHGAAVAFAADKLGHKARIFVPKISSLAKIERIRSYDAELVVEGERYDDALALCDKHAMNTGALKVHAFEQFETLLGQRECWSGI
jgi:threonine dehydratase